MDKIELLKEVMARTPLGQAPFLTKLEAKLSLSSLKSDPIDRECSMSCDVIDSICEKGHEFVETLPFAYETSRAIHVNIDLLGHAKKEEIHRQAENLRQSLRDYMNAMQTWEEIIIYWIAFPCERICSRITIDEVKMLIAKEEPRTPELKKVSGELHHGMVTACAFLDSDGGVAG